MTRSGVSRMLPRPALRAPPGTSVAVVQPRVEERALAVHLGVGDVGVPVRDRAPAGVGVEVLAGQPERRGEQRRRRSCRRGGSALPSWFELRVVPARAPAREHLAAPSASSTPSRSANGFRVGASATIAPTFEVAVRPAVEPAADALHERVVDGRVAEGAGDADAEIRLSFLSKTPLTPTTASARSSSSGGLGVRRGSTAPSLSTSTRIFGSFADVHLEAELRAPAGRQARPDAALLLAEDRLVEAELAAPERPRCRTCRSGRSRGPSSSSLAAWLSTRAS